MLKKVFVTAISLSLIFGCGKKDKEENARDPNPTDTTQSEPANAKELGDVGKDFNKYIAVKSTPTYAANQTDVTFHVDVNALRAAGYSERTIKEITAFYSEIEYTDTTAQATYGYQTYGKIKIVVKSVKWLKSNWNVVLNKVPAPVKKTLITYIKIDIFFGLLDKYTNYTDKVEEVLKRALNDMLPWWLEWSTPGIVFVITLLIPVL